MTLLKDDLLSSAVHNFVFLLLSLAFCCVYLSDLERTPSTCIDADFSFAWDELKYT